MRKLIRKGNTGFEFNPPEISNSLANTGNVGATNALGIDYNSPSAMLDKFKSIVGPSGGSTALDNILPLRGGTPISLGDVSGFNKGFFSKIGGGIKKFFGGSAGGGTPYGMIGSAADTLSSLIPTHKSSETQAADAVFDNVSNGVMMINPLAGTIMKAGGLVSDGLNALGVRTDQVTGIDKALGSKWLSLTGTGLLNNSITTKLASLLSGQDVQDTMARLDGGYGDFMNSWDEASKYSGKTIGLLNSASKYNNKIYNANHMMDVLRNITGKKYIDDLLTALMADRWNERTMMDMNGGPGNISFGRLGLKVEILPKVHAILNKPKVLDTLKEWEEVPEFKEGGKMNVIPEGSLHARLHHMENADGLTKKGIPVVSIAEGGELELLAEIELNEIIFNLEVTTELEKLMKDGSDSAAIEAGKLLVKEIFENTDDRTGLIKLLEPEKKEPTTEDIVKNHQVFLEGGTLPTLKTIEELVDYAIKLNPAFVLRIGPNMGYAEFIDKNGKKARGTHYLETGTDDLGKYVVYPRIQMKDGRLLDLGDKANDEAKRNKNFLIFDNAKDAELFVTLYKDSKLWKPFFDIWKQRYGSYKNGGIIEQIENLSPDKLEELLKIIKYLNL